MAGGRRLGVFVRTRAPRGCGSLWVWVRGRASPCLCVSVALHGCLEPRPRFVSLRLVVVPVGASCVSAYVVCACRRVWVGCRWSARAQNQTPPRLSFPAVHPPPDLASNFSPGSFSNSLSPPGWAGRGASAALPSFTS